MARVRDNRLSLTRKEVLVLFNILQAQDELGRDFVWSFEISKSTETRYVTPFLWTMHRNNALIDVRYVEVDGVTEIGVTWIGSMPLADFLMEVVDDKSSFKITTSAKAPKEYSLPDIREYLIKRKEKNELSEGVATTAAATEQREIEQSEGTSGINSDGAVEVGSTGTPQNAE